MNTDADEPMVVAAANGELDQLDPALVIAGQVLREMGLSPVAPDIGGIQAARKSADAFGLFLSEAGPVLTGEAVITLAGPHGPFDCRIFPAQIDAPALVYFHGGGFAMGKASGWDGLMREIVRSSGVTAISVDYRLSPEHRFPIAFEEAYYAIDFILSNPHAFGIDPRRVAIGGDSAGANLALGAASFFGAGGRHKLAMLLLFYGAYSQDIQSPSWRRFGDGSTGLSRATMAWIWDNYLSCPDDHRDARAAPLNADLTGLPPTYLSVGSMDPLLDESLRLQEHLAAAGIAHSLRIWPGLNHGFVRLHEMVPAAGRAVEAACLALRGHFDTANP